jgi:galactokinase
MAAVQRAEEFVVSTPVPNHNGQCAARTRKITCRWDAEALLSAATDETEFFRYTAGVAYHVFAYPKVTGGVSIKITSMDLPVKKGVSSSAAVCVLVARAFDKVYGLGLYNKELMELAYVGERLTGSRCGRMDQVCVYGKTPVLLQFRKSCPVRIEPVFPKRRIHMFFVDLAGTKDTVRILSDLQRSYPDNDDLQLALGERNEAIVRAAYQALNEGDAEIFGKLMTQAQQNFDALVAPHSAEQLRSPLLHRLLRFRDIAEHVYGGKGVGSQGDGTAQFVARSAADREAAMRKIQNSFPTMRCYPLEIG